MKLDDTTFRESGEGRGDTICVESEGVSGFLKQISHAASVSQPVEPHAFNPGGGIAHFGDM